MNAGDYNYLDKVKNPHIIASKNKIYVDALKKFLAKLETPIVPYENFNKLMAVDALSPAHVAAEVK